MAALAWFLEDFALPFSIGMLIGIVAEWVRPHLWDLTVLVRSTLLLRQIHAEHRSRTPDGSAGPGGGNRRGPSPGGEVRDPCTPHLPAMNTAPDVRDPQAPSGEEAGGVSQRSVAPLPPAGDTCPTKSAATSAPTATATTATATPAAPPTAPAAKTAQPRTAPEKARP
jgi:hypothetical protein